MLPAAQLSQNASHSTTLTEIGDRHQFAKGNWLAVPNSLQQPRSLRICALGFTKQHDALQHVIMFIESDGRNTSGASSR